MYFEEFLDYKRPNYSFCFQKHIKIVLYLIETRQIYLLDIEVVIGTIYKS